MTNDSLRRAAILIAALDHRSADALLDQMPPEQAALVRRAIMDLDAVNDSEQQEVIQHFMRPHTQDGPTRADGVELALSGHKPEGVAHQPKPAPTRDPSEPKRPSLPFLRQADTQQLVALLGHEHPQTIAVVTSQLPPDRASELLVRLPGPLQTDVLRRVAMLGDTDPQIVREIQETIDTRLSQYDPAGRAGSKGILAIKAILAATDSHHREGLVARLAKHDPQLVQCLGQNAGAARAHPLPNTGQLGKVPAPPPSFAERDIPGQDRPDDPCERPSLSTSGHPSDPGRPRSAPAPVDLTFADLAELDEHGWAAILSQAPAEVVLIALVGAGDPLVEGILRQLPSRQARCFRRQMCQLGPIRLRDVEQAQQQLAHLAQRLGQQGKIQTPAGARYVAAA